MARAPRTSDERHHRDVRRCDHDADDEADDERAEHDDDVDRHRAELEALVATLPTEPTRSAAVLLGEPTGEERAAPATPRAAPPGTAPQHRRQRRTCRGRSSGRPRGSRYATSSISPMRPRRRSLPDFAGCAADSPACCSSSPRSCSPSPPAAGGCSASRSTRRAAGPSPGRSSRMRSSAPQLAAVVAPAAAADTRDSGERARAHHRPRHRQPAGGRVPRRHRRRCPRPGRRRRRTGADHRAADGQHRAQPGRRRRCRR